MSMNKRAKRFFSFILAIIMLIPNLTVFPVSVMAATEYYNSQKLRTENSAGKGVIISINGSNDTANFAPTQVVWDNPVTKVSYQAYCVNPAYPGYGDAGTYDITVESFDDDTNVGKIGSNGAGQSAGVTARGSVKTFKAALWGAVASVFTSARAETLLKGEAETDGAT